MATPGSPATIAHLLKRTTFGVPPSRVDEVAALGLEGAIELLVDRATPPQLPPPPFQNIYDIYKLYEDFYYLIDYELKRLAGPTVGLGDRMLWFWHGIITSAMSKVFFPSLLFRQHQLLAKHALGNFRQMLIDITIDPAMLIYLDGIGSNGAAPNENYSRELMELFSLGVGNYSQEDVVAGAQALSGWEIGGFPYQEGQAFNPDDMQSYYNSYIGFPYPLAFLGKSSYFDVPALIERVLERKACGRFIARKLFQYFVHPNPDSKTIDYLAVLFRTSNYEIRPLLSALFRLPEFVSREARGSRARQPVELLLATAAAFSAPIDAFDWYSFIDATGQFPFEPPNVAGWPLDNRWLSASHTLARTRLGLTAAYLGAQQNRAIKAVANASNPVNEALRRTLLYQASARTYNELERVASEVSNPETRAWALLALAVASPEFALA